MFRFYGFCCFASSELCDEHSLHCFFIFGIHFLFNLPQGTLTKRIITDNKKCFFDLILSSCWTSNVCLFIYRKNIVFGFISHLFPNFARKRESRKRLVNPFFQLVLSRLSLILALRRSHVLFINAHTICCLTILTLYDSFWYVTYYSFTTLKVLHLGAQIYTWVFCNILSWLKFMNKSV